jgi:hypothetical protein
MLPALGMLLCNLYPINIPITTAIEKRRGMAVDDLLLFILEVNKLVQSC